MTNLRAIEATDVPTVVVNQKKLLKSQQQALKRLCGRIKGNVSHLDNHTTEVQTEVSYGPPNSTSDERID